MKRKYCFILAVVTLMIGLVLSGCGAEENHLTEDSNAAAVEENNTAETTDMAALGNDQTPVTEESVGEIVLPKATHWTQAYLAIAEEIEAKYGFPMEYDLIYLDGDNIPELVAGPTGYWFILYTWRDGEIYELIDYAPYGLHGRIYCYEPHQGIIEESVYEDSDSYTIFYTIYHTVTEDMEIVEQYELSEDCRETGRTYFYRDASMTESREIDEEEFSSYQKENLPELSGRFDLEVLCFLLGNEDDASVHSSDYGNMADEAVRSLLVTKTVYDKEGEVTSQGQIKYEYDSAGNQIRVLLGHEGGTYYEYDDSDNLIEMVRYEDGIIISHEKYEYDEDGRKIKSLACVGEKAKTVSVYKYNYYGNMTMEVVYSYSGIIVKKTSCLYEYGRSGELIREIFSLQDILGRIEEYEYDDSGNLIKDVSYDEEGNVIWFIGYDYNENGNIIEETTLSYIKKYEYDEQNNKTKEIYFLCYDYDENGNIIEETTLSYIKKYEYDEQNNKTKEIYYLIDGSIDHYIEWTYEWQ